MFHEEGDVTGKSGRKAYSLLSLQFSTEPISTLLKIIRFF